MVATGNGFGLVYCPPITPQLSETESPPMIEMYVDGQDLDQSQYLSHFIDFDRLTGSFHPQLRSRLQVSA